MNNKKIMIIDGNSILNRAFYGMGSLTTREGIYTNAVFGFLKIMRKYLKEENPEYLCVTFDLREPTFRHKEYDGYKAKRKGMPDDLAMQVPLIKEVLDAMNIKRLEIPGYEADDIIGSLAKKAKESGIDVVILTGDRDSLQLVEDGIKVKIPKTKMGKTSTEDYDVLKIREVYGLEPKALIEVKGLMGDASDNIPGVRGVGEKTALDLISKYKTIENVYSNIENITKKSLKEKLIQDKDMAFLSRKLGTIYKDLDVFCDSDDFLIKEYDEERLYEIFKKLEFKSFIDEFGLGQNQDYNIKKKVEDILCISDVFSLSDFCKKVEDSGSLYFCYSINDGRLKDFVVLMDNKVYRIDFSCIDFESFLSILRPLFESDSIKKYTNNAKDFYKLLFRHDIKLNNLMFDTMIAGYLLEPSDDNFDIENLSMKFLNEKMPESNNIVEHVDILKRLVDTLIDKIEEKNQHNLYYDIELPLIEVLASLEFWGFKIDKSKLMDLTNILNEKIDVLTGSIYELVGEQFNINSPKQLGVILCEKLGLKLKKTKTGYSTDAKTLEALSDKSKVVELILEYRKLTKLKSTYTEGLQDKINEIDGKIHSTFNQTVTVTGRISSTEPNLQNIPIKTELGRLIRKAFVPENEDYVLLDADYSQIELRVLAHVTKDPGLIEAFRNGEDIHKSTASRVFGVSLEDVTPILRRRAKAINFGIIYGMGDFSLSKDLGISRKEAAEYIDSYFEKYQKVKEYLDDVVKLGEENGYVSTIFNRLRYLPELKSKNFNIKAFGKRVAMNMPIQGSAADIIKIAMVKMYKELKSRNLKSRLILQIHDELLIETNKDEIDEVSCLLKECMENAVCLDVPLTVEVKCGHNLYEAK